MTRKNPFLYILIFLWSVGLYGVSPPIYIEKIDFQLGWLSTDVYICTSDGIKWKIIDREMLYEDEWQVGNPITYDKEGTYTREEYRILNGITHAKIRVIDETLIPH